MTPLRPTDRRNPQAEMSKRTLCAFFFGAAADFSYFCTLLDS
jgi:hypothetical protein